MVDKLESTEEPLGALEELKVQVGELLFRIGQLEEGSSGANLGLERGLGQAGGRGGEPIEQMATPEELSLTPETDSMLERVARLEGARREREEREEEEEEKGDLSEEIEDLRREVSRRGGERRREEPELLVPGVESFWAEITGSAEADAPAQNRWTYSWKEKVKSSSGYGGWTDRSPSRTGTNDAYNAAENMNDGADEEGNGVDVSHLVDAGVFDFAIVAVPDASIVLLTPVQVGSSFEYWFTHENGIDGTCD